MERAEAAEADAAEWRGRAVEAERVLAEARDAAASARECAPHQPTPSSGLASRESHQPALPVVAGPLWAMQFSTES